MQLLMGYSLVKDDKEVQYWGDILYQCAGIPDVIYLPNGDIVHCPQLYQSYSSYQLVQRMVIFDPEQESLYSNDVITFNQTDTIVTRQYRAPTQQDLLSYSANSRFTVETSGATIDGFSITTDRNSQAMITGVVTLFSLSPNTVINYKTSNGFIQANSIVLTNIALGVANHVQTAFAIEAAVANQIMSNTITSFTQIDHVYASANIP